MKRLNMLTPKSLISIIVATVFIAALSTVLLTGCGKDNGDEQSAESGAKYNREYFSGWMRHTSQSGIFELRCPQRETLAERLEPIGAKCDEILMLLAQMLQTRPPENIFLMVFESQVEAEKLLGRELPYVSGDTIYYDVFYPLGAPIAELMMKRVHPEGSRFNFVNEGFPTLIDFSGQNYHARAFEHLENGTLIPLDTLLDTLLYKGLPYPQRKEQAASFIGYLTLNYGSAPIVGLVKSGWGNASGSSDGMSISGILRLATKKGVDVLGYEWRKALPNLAKPASPDTTEVTP